MHFRIELLKLVEMSFEPIGMIWDTVPKKIWNGHMKIGTIFAVHGNFCFYDLMNTLQHLFEIYHNWNLFCLVNGSGSLRLLQAICFFWSQAEYIGIKNMLESVHKVEKTKNSVRYCHEKEAAICACLSRASAVQAPKSQQSEFPYVSLRCGLFTDPFA